MLLAWRRQCDSCLVAQIPSRTFTLPTLRAVVAFLSDGSNQNTGFEIAWDQGLFCDPLTDLYSSSGTFTDGTPIGKRYRWHPNSCMRSQS